MTRTEQSLTFLVIGPVLLMLAYLTGPPKGNKFSYSNQFLQVYRNWTIFGGIVAILVGLISLLFPSR